MDQVIDGLHVIYVAQPTASKHLSSVDMFFCRHLCSIGLWVLYVFRGI